jgi:hypothetical protein
MLNPPVIRKKTGTAIGPKKTRNMPTHSPHFNSRRVSGLRRPKLWAGGMLALVAWALGLTVWQETPVSPNAASHPVGTISVRVGNADNRPVTKAPAVPVTQKQPWEKLRTKVLHAQSITDTIEQSAALERIMEDVTPEAAARLLADFDPEEMKGSGARALFDLWATSNPQDAVAWAQGLGDPETRQAFLHLSALRWATVNLPAAAAWARSLPEGDARTEIMAAVGSEAVRSDPLEAMLIGFELPACSVQADLILRAAAEWAATDRHNAVGWATQIKDPHLLQQVTERVVVASAEADPLAAVTIALQQMAPGAAQDRAMVSIVQRWAQTDPELAAAWVSGFPGGSLGRDAMDNLIGLWATRDSVASGKWLLTLPSGELREAGLLAHARVIERINPHRGEGTLSQGQD